MVQIILYNSLLTGTTFWKTCLRYLVFQGRSIYFTILFTLLIATIHPLNMVSDFVTERMGVIFFLKGTVFTLTGETAANHCLSNSAVARLFPKKADSSYSSFQRY